jgi:glycoprotein-N-acetylgalactosamine 3-beta-galactosyltransferase
MFLITFFRKDDGGSEDVEIGQCLQNVNVTAGDSRDQSGKPRFFAISPDNMMFPG